MLLSQDRRKLTPLLIVKDILQKTKFVMATFPYWISEWDAFFYAEIIFLRVLILKLKEGTKGKCGAH